MGWLVLTTFFGIPDHYLYIHFATGMALRWKSTSVRHQNSVQLML